MEDKQVAGKPARQDVVVEVVADKSAAIDKVIVVGVDQEAPSTGKVEHAIAGIVGEDVALDQHRVTTGARGQNRPRIQDDRAVSGDAKVLQGDGACRDRPDGHCAAGEGGLVIAFDDAQARKSRSGIDEPELAKSDDCIVRIAEPIDDATGNKFIGDRGEVAVVGGNPRIDQDRTTCAQGQVTAGA